MYGTSLKAIEDVQHQGKACILDIDVQGAQQVRKSGLSAYFIFIKPPSFEVLKNRLEGRKTESEDKVAIRLKNALHEMEVAEQNEGNLFDEFIEAVDFLQTARSLMDAVYYKVDEKSNGHH
eukprot:NODE_9590_length_578_cov_43.780220_g8953_i0.p1 GENE.NODE_9590_length_578_cov_43.780220_g8953_i0~~NODE_9590_length_578_cov_43.780220_g8953_i0.p1  ORF type:complete len:142 (+),score=44.45 NODE_9590_length_578_cov_43.780220_g8953_i0:64-426(+)